MRKICRIYEKIKRDNVCLLGILEGQEKEKETESICKAIMTEDSPGLGENFCNSCSCKRYKGTQIGLHRETL